MSEDEARERYYRHQELPSRVRDWDFGPWGWSVKKTVEKDVVPGMFAYVRADFLRDLRDVLGDSCPVCAGELDTGRECLSCGTDAMTVISRFAAKSFFTTYKPEFERHGGAAEGAKQVAERLRELWGPGGLWGVT